MARVGAGVAFNKFDPHKPEDGKVTNPQAARRARILKWVNWVVLLYTVMGFGFIAYWLVQAN